MGTQTARLDLLLERLSVENYMKLKDIGPSVLRQNSQLKDASFMKKLSLKQLVSGHNSVLGFFPKSPDLR